MCDEIDIRNFIFAIYWFVSKCYVDAIDCLFPQFVKIFKYISFILAIYMSLNDLSN